MVYRDDLADLKDTSPYEKPLKAWLAAITSARQTVRMALMIQSLNTCRSVLRERAAAEAEVLSSLPALPLRAMNATIADDRSGTIRVRSDGANLERYLHTFRDGLQKLWLQLASPSIDTQRELSLTSGLHYANADLFEILSALTAGLDRRAHEPISLIETVAMIADAPRLLSLRPSSDIESIELANGRWFLALVRTMRSGSGRGESVRVEARGKVLLLSVRSPVRAQHPVARQGRWALLQFLAAECQTRAFDDGHRWWVLIGPDQRKQLMITGTT